MIRVRHLTLLLPLLVVTTFLVHPCRGALLYGPSAYTSFADSPFYPAAGFDYFYLEDFEDGALNVPGVAASAGGFLGPASYTDSVDGDNGSIDGSGNGGHSYFLSSFSSVTFTFDAFALGELPTHAGMVLTDIGYLLDHVSIGVGTVSFEAFDADNNSLGVVGPIVFGDGAVDGGTAEDRFFGVRNLGGISKISFTLNSDDWEMDHLQYGAVPEPSSLLLAALAALAVPVQWRSSFRRCDPV